MPLPRAEACTATQTISKDCRKCCCSVTKPLTTLDSVETNVGRSEVPRTYSTSESSCPNHMGRLRSTDSHSASTFRADRAIDMGPNVRHERRP